MKNKLITALISVVIAFGLWMYVITVVSPGSEASFHDVPVAFQSESALSDRGLIITDYKNTTVDLRLAGNRSDLNKLNRSNITVTADVSKIYEAGVHSLNYAITYPGDIANDAITVQSRDPGTVTVTVEEKISKFVDVSIQYKGVLPEDVISDKENASLDHSSISVTGPKSVIDQISYAKIEVNLEGQKQTISQDYDYVLCDENDQPVDTTWVTANVEKVNLTLKIQHWKVIKLKVNKNYGGLTAEDCQIIQSVEELLISGSITQLETLSEELVLGTIELNEILDDETLTFPIELPEGIENETGIQEVTVQVKFNDLSKKDFKITRFEAVNVPVGMSAEFLTQAMTVTLRGTKAKLDAIKAEDVVVVVDFSLAQAGTAKMKATVTVKDQNEGVGAVGTYMVSATLKEVTSGGR